MERSPGRLGRGGRWVVCRLSGRTHGNFCPVCRVFSRGEGVLPTRRRRILMRHRPILIAVAITGVLAAGAIVAVIVFSAWSTPPAALTQPTWTLTRLVVDGQEQTLSSSS